MMKLDSFISECKNAGIDDKTVPITEINWKENFWILHFSIVKKCPPIKEKIGTKGWDICTAIVETDLCDIATSEYGNP